MLECIPKPLNKTAKTKEKDNHRTLDFLLEELGLVRWAGTAAAQ